MLHIQELTEPKSLTMGCKQTCPNFASDGDIILIILDSKQICPRTAERPYLHLPRLLFTGQTNILEKIVSLLANCKEAQEIHGELSPNERKALSCSFL